MHKVIKHNFPASAQRKFKFSPYFLRISLNYFRCGVPRVYASERIIKLRIPAFYAVRSRMRNAKATRNYLNETLVYIIKRLVLMRPGTVKFKNVILDIIMEVLYGTFA